MATLKHNLRRLLSRSLNTLPTALEYKLRAGIERHVYNRTAVVHDLPEIFHYWSNRYVRPQFEALGFSSPDDFVLRELLRLAEQSEKTLRCASLGSGRCETEIALVTELRKSGHDVHFTCTDLNPRLLETGRRNAQSAGVAESIEFVATDVNKINRLGTYDAIVAMQCLHHFVELESILSAVKEALSPTGLFLTSDVIGRNGHQMWPEALEVLQSFWRELPERLRVDSRTGNVLAEYDNVDHSDVSFEGVRAQDILPLLVDRFEFEVFAPFACITIPFVDRRFGSNYDPTNDQDRAIIDRIAATDEQLIKAGTLKPTQLVAALCRGPATRFQSTLPYSPQEAIRLVV
jgi:2-polyprenyl-3-methyl-5-hydroxy-6-metoxy-1,4-benzoquinol methylase